MRERGVTLIPFLYRTTKKRQRSAGRGGERGEGESEGRGRGVRSGKGRGEREGKNPSLLHPQK